MSFRGTPENSCQGPSSSTGQSHLAICENFNGRFSARHPLHKSLLVGLITTVCLVPRHSQALGSSGHQGRNEPVRREVRHFGAFSLFAQWRAHEDGGSLAQPPRGARGRCPDPLPRPPTRLSLRTAWPPQCLMVSATPRARSWPCTLFSLGILHACQPRTAAALNSSPVLISRALESPFTRLLPAVSRQASVKVITFLCTRAGRGARVASPLRCSRRTSTTSTRTRPS